MKIRLFNTFVACSFLLFLFSCQSETAKEDKNLAPNAHRVTANEVIQTTQYTYVMVSSEETEYWVAINKKEVKEGETYYWSVGSEMNNFESKELKRTFPSIFFVQDFTDIPILSKANQPAASMPGRQQVPKFNDIAVEKAPGGISIAELLSSKDTYIGKKIRTRGRVVKFSAAIMNRNWVHLQDGTEHDGNYDLTITTNDTVKYGDIVTFEGIVALDKDFGAGYSYDVILVDAVVAKKE